MGFGCKFGVEFCTALTWTQLWSLHSLLHIHLSLLLTPTAVLAGPVMTSNRRWIFPCNGQTTIDVSSDVIDLGGAASAAVQSSSATSSASLQELAENFHQISTKAHRLRRQVRELKDLYVKDRFRDESLVQDLEQIGLRLAGMPEPMSPTVADINSAAVTETIHRAFEHLSRVAVFIDQARIGESLAVNEATSYEQHFSRIEDHHEHGIYWLLCALQRVIRSAGSPVSGSVVDSVMAMRVVEVDRNSMRHTRDYIVLRDFERILQRLTVEFASLKRTHTKRHGGA